MQQTPTPVDSKDPEELVLERILSTLEQFGPMPLETIIEDLHLFQHPAAEKILGTAIGDGMIAEDAKAGKVMINELGREVGKDIRKSLEAKTSHGGVS